MNYKLKYVYTHIFQTKNEQTCLFSSGVVLVQRGQIVVAPQSTQPSTRPHQLQQHHSRRWYLVW